MLNANDDMDNLFKRAAENYPLNTDSGDWDKVLEKLAGAGTETFVPLKPGKRNYRYLWLLLLLPGILAGYSYFTSHNQKLPVSNVKERPGKLQATPGENIAGDKNTGAVLSHPNQNYTAIQSGGTFTDQNYKSPGNNKRTGVLKVSKTKAISKSTIGLGQSDQNTDEPNSSANKNEIKVKDIEKNITSSPLQKNINPVNNNDVSGKEKNTVATDSSKNNTAVVIKNKKKISNHKKDHFLYAGVMAGADISAVKFQSVKNMGNNIGIVTGYQLNKRIDIESGLISVKKFYYSDGKYFNTGKIYLPPGAKIAKVNGDCRMLEVPLNLKYNFKTSGKGKSNWFALAGVSSWFMKKENYDYTITAMGQPYQHYSTYDNSSAFWLSVVNLGAGYSRPVGRSGTFRIEPYVKIPLKGVGVGSLPIMSSGVNIGFTKKLF